MLVFSSTAHSWACQVLIFRAITSIKVARATTGSRSLCKILRALIMLTSPLPLSMSQSKIAKMQDLSRNSNSGQSGRMRMFLWDFTDPERDGALENDIVSHEVKLQVSRALLLHSWANSIEHSRNHEQDDRGRHRAVLADHGSRRYG